MNQNASEKIIKIAFEYIQLQNEVEALKDKLSNELATAVSKLNEKGREFNKPNEAGEYSLYNEFAIQDDNWVYLFKLHTDQKGVEDVQWINLLN